MAVRGVKGDGWAQNGDAVHTGVAVSPDGSVASGASSIPTMDNFLFKAKKDKEN